MFPDGQVVNGKTVSTAPTAFVVVGRGTLESGSEAESQVDVFTGPRRKVKGTKVFLGEVVPAIIGAGCGQTVVDDVLRRCAPGVLLESTIVVKSTPDGGAGWTSTCNRRFLWATDEVPSRCFAVHFNDGEVVPNVPDNEAGTVGTAQGTKAKVPEEFNAHESTVCARQVNIVEDHSVVPVLTIAAPRVAGAVGFHLSSPHEVGWVDVVRRDVGIVVSATGCARRMVVFKVPFCSTINVFFVGPSTACATSGLDLRRIPIVGIHGVVGRVGFVDDLEFNIQVSTLPVEGVHARVGDGHVDGTGSFANDAKEAVGR